MELAQIHPRHSRAYSPNLHRWLRQQPSHHILNREIRDQVYRVTASSLLCRRYIFAPGELVIGLPFENEPFADDFSGAQLMHVLTMGSQAIRMCYPGGMSGLEHIADFWERYRAIGRCAIDPEHNMHFIDEANRFVVLGDNRTCQWCGAQHHRTVRIEHVETEVWKAA